MQILICFYFLAIAICQPSGAANYTRMIYFNLKIDMDAFKTQPNYVAQNLIYFGNNTWTVTSSTVTTSCSGDNTSLMCTCNPGYVWTKKVCQTQKCCGNTKCTFSANSTHMCVSDNSVTIVGSIYLVNEYNGCLAPQTDQTFKDCNKNVTDKIMAQYSTIGGFDLLKIIQYSVGSIIVTYQVIFASAVTTTQLLDISLQLSSNLDATRLDLVTSGVLKISMPPNPVPYWSNGTVACTSQEDLGSLTWQLRQQDAVYNITNGTQATVISNQTTSAVHINNITELWEGNFSCVYVTTASRSTTLTHSASIVMDVALLPKIVLSTEPQYPRCSAADSLLSIQISCQVAQDMENYTVSFETQNITAAITQQPYSPGQKVYLASTVVDCKTTNASFVMCNFKNICNQTATAISAVNIIKFEEKFCSAEDPWPDTKMGFASVLPCTDAAGQLRRTCTDSAQWGVQESRCVYRSLFNTLQKAMIIDTGVGDIERNAAVVFSQFRRSTNDSKLINTFSNIATSVSILTNMQTKLRKINNMSAVNDFLASSSNLLDTSLNTSWESNVVSNSSLAEQYLFSVEDLIRIADLSNAMPNQNVRVNTCNGTNCNNTVFNVNVSVPVSSISTVKIAGFQQLQNYLPDGDQIPNSIVVSVTTDAQLSASFAVTIDFDLLVPRSRNVPILCVSWSNSSRSWSQLGCEWQGAASGGRCVCSHLTSFAILMAKKPIELPWSTQVTYAGLSVSIVSLLLSLGIEMAVWSAVVKTNTLYLRHTAQVNVSMCLLVADVCFLASATDGPNRIPTIWCQTSAVLKHFCYLAMFFWMLCLSTTLLHQAVFLFHSVSKKTYLRFSMVLGYICPFLIVFITFVSNNVGGEGTYYSAEGCWLVYTGMLKGSIFTFVIPVGIIIFINVFSMLVVIMKLLDRPSVTDKSHDKEKNAAKTVVRTVILLTPIFGITWSLGFAVMIIDLTSGLAAIVVNYAFTVLNSLQGFFILLTTCIGDKMVREALLGRFRNKAASSVSESTTKLDSSWKK